MTKRQKKRNKRYMGDDARPTGVSGQNKPVIHKFEAKQRNPLFQWLYEHKQSVRIALIVTGVLAFIALIIIGLIQTFSK